MKKTLHRINGGGGTLSLDLVFWGCGSKKTCYNSDMRDHYYVKKFGFTLAEVLITLGIIGVVAAMTMPSLIAKYKEKVTVTQLTAAYSLLSQAFTRMTQEEGTIDLYGSTNVERADVIFEKLSKYLQMTKVCDHNQSGCQASGGYGYKGDQDDRQWLTAQRNYAFILKNGMTLRLLNHGSCVQDTTMTKTGAWELDESVQGSFYGTYAHSCGIIYVDINGFKGPNNLDIDVFQFAIVKNGVVPVGSSKENSTYNSFNNCITPKSHGTCAAWVIYNKNMDYLRCPDKLSWEGKHSCGD